jgi:hypothetical protein
MVTVSVWVRGMTTGGVYEEVKAVSVSKMVFVPEMTTSVVTEVRVAEETVTVV